jgi:hypothetical protein
LVNGECEGLKSGRKRMIQSVGMPG